MFVLLIVHNVFNRRWYGAVTQTRAEPRSLINLGVTILLLTGMLALLATSVLISNTLADFISAYGGFTARQVHVSPGTGFSSLWLFISACAGRC